MDHCAYCIVKSLFVLRAPTRHQLNDVGPLKVKANSLLTNLPAKVSCNQHYMFECYMQTNYKELWETTTLKSNRNTADRHRAPNRTFNWSQRP